MNRSIDRSRNHSLRHRSWSAFLVLSTGLASVIVACGESDPPAEAAVPPNSSSGLTGGSLEEIVAAAEAAETALAAPWTSPSMPHGEEACSDCHEQIVQDWLATPMARALGPVVPEEFEGLRSVRDGAGLRYEFEVEGDTIWMAETHDELADGHLRVKVAYAIGAGTVDRSYVARLGSFDWFAPLEVVSTHAGRFAALAPGHEIQPGSRFTVGITDECLACHTDSLPPERFPLNAAPPVDWEPRGISCKSCHGSVEAHAEWQYADLAGDEPAGQDPITRAGNLTRTQRMSTCAACHLQGDARIALGPDSVGPPRVGVDVLERRALFVAREPSDEIGFVSQTERLVLSECYLASDTMTCETCHDPHRGLHDERERKRTRDACGLCHPGGPTEHGGANASACSRMATPKDGDCASCHMRVRPVFDVAEVEIHDHYIRTKPGPPRRTHPLRVAESAEGDWRRFAWPGEPTPEHFDDPGLWMMAENHNGHVERAARRVDEPVGPTVERLPMYHHVRGSLLERSGRVDDAIAAYERALALDPRLAASAINLGLLLGQTNQVDAGIAHLDRVIERHPLAVGALRNRAALGYMQGDASTFENYIERAFRAQPSGELARLIADWKRSRGDVGSARMWAARAEALNPLLSPQDSTGAPR